MFSLFILLIAQILAQGSPHRHHHHHHHDESSSSGSSLDQFSTKADKDWPHEEVLMRPAGNNFDIFGVYPFNFGRAGTWALQSFSLYITGAHFIQVWDCFCGGDRFSLYVNGEFRGTTNSFCQYSNESCNFFNSDPLTCLANQGWCKFCPLLKAADVKEAAEAEEEEKRGEQAEELTIYSVVRLDPGFYNLTILTAASFYDRGVGFIMAYPELAGK